MNMYISYAQILTVNKIFPHDITLFIYNVGVEEAREQHRAKMAPDNVSVSS